MANNTLELVLTAKDEASAKLQGVGKSLDGLGDSFKKVGAISATIFAGISTVAVKTLKDFADAEAQTVVTNQSLTNSFNSLGTAALGNLQKQLKGTVGGLEGLKNMADKAGQSAVKLGFDDEVASRSFAKLFAVTKDTTQANKEMALAMDLARYKGISLEDATQKLIMVHSGATKELKSLGISVTEGATAMENLDSITKQVTGSSETYAKTTAGAMEVLDVQMGNLSETIGAQLAPVLGQVLTAITPVLLAVTNWIQANPELFKWIIIIVGAVTGLVAILGALAVIMPFITGAFLILLGPVGLIIAAIAAVIAITVLLVKNWDSIRTYFKTLWDDIVLTFKTAIDSIVAYFDNLLDRARQVIDKVSAISGSFGGVIKAAAFTVAPVASTIVSGVSSVIGKRATGGNVSSGSNYLVGENGPEMFSPSGSGVITPNNRMGSGNQNITINLTGTFLSEDSARKVGDMIIKNFKNMSRVGA